MNPQLHLKEITGPNKGGKNRSFNSGPSADTQMVRKEGAQKRWQEILVSLV